MASSAPPEGGVTMNNMAMIDLSLDQTQALLEIVESGDMTKLEEFIAVHGYDEGTDNDLEYRTIRVSYWHRYARAK
jgi:hypothetical protein